MEGVLKMWNRAGTKSKGLIWAIAGNTFTGAGSASVTPTLPNGGIGVPVLMRVSSSVQGNAILNISNSQQIVALSNPNAPPVEVEIPPGAFPGKQGSVAVTLNASGAGTINVAIGFAP
jgi:hypothetical protein